MSPRDNTATDATMPDASSYDEEVSAAANMRPTMRGTSSTRGKNHRATIEENISRLVKTVEEAGSNTQPPTISLVRAFLACAPAQRTPELFACVIDRGLEDKKLIVSGWQGSAEDLSKALKDDWFTHCTMEGNQHLPAATDTVRDMGFIGMMLKHPVYSQVKVSLPTSAPAAGAPPAPPSCDA